MSKLVLEHPLHITVASAYLDSRSLEHEIQILKAALLYANTVKLCSINSLVVALSLTYEHTTPLQQLNFLEKLFPSLATDERELARLTFNAATYKELLAEDQLSNRELLIKLQMESSLAQ